MGELRFPVSGVDKGLRGGMCGFATGVKRERVKSEKRITALETIDFRSALATLDTSRTPLTSPKNTSPNNTSPPPNTSSKQAELANLK